MPYDQALANRMRPLLLTRPGVIEKNMFGGIGFMVNGNMCCGIWKNLLVIRLGVEDSITALKKPNVRPMDITGKPMKGWLFVEPKGYAKDQLLGWIEQAFAFASGLKRK